MAQRQVPSIGRAVHFVLAQGPSAGQHRPGTIVRVWDEPAHPGSAVQLQVLTDGSNDGDAYKAGVYWATSVTHAPAEEHKPGTYHFPEFVPPVEA